MNYEATDAILKVADIHVKTLQDALDDMATKHPFNTDFISNLNKTDLRTLETMTSRFAKLQDLMGTKIIDIYLQNQSQPIEGLSIIDKIHKLEKLNMIDSEDVWIELRKVRNHIAHEYPDDPQLAAKHLNNVFELAPNLILIYQKIAKELQRSS